MSNNNQKINGDFPNVKIIRKGRSSTIFIDEKEIYGVTNINTITNYGSEEIDQRVIIEIGFMKSLVIEGE